MRCWGFWVCVSLVLAGSVQGFAQQPAGPRTLEGLLNSDDAQKPAAAVAEAAETGSTDAGPKRLAGTVARPIDGVKHPDLDKAWADYKAAVGKVTESIKAAINKQFDAATAKGDLDAAEKWQAAMEKFEKVGEVPTDKEVKTAMSAAISDLTKAREELSAAYEAVVKTLTMDKKIAEAKAVRGELTEIRLVLTKEKPEGQTTQQPFVQGTGLMAEYFANQKCEPESRVCARIESAVDRDFLRDPVGNGAPQVNFSARWSGSIVPERTDAYIFTGISDDGIRLTVDGQCIVDEWRGREGQFSSKPIRLQAKKRYPLVVEYYQGGGAAVIRVGWQSTRAAWEVLPTRCLFPSENPVHEGKP